MTSQLHLAYGIVGARAHQGQDRALLRDVELAQQDARRQRRSRRHQAR
ncbi:hypothetical protein [Nocardioides sp.]